MLKILFALNFFQYIFNSVINLVRILYNLHNFLNVVKMVSISTFSFFCFRMTIFSFLSCDDGWCAVNCHYISHCFIIVYVQMTIICICRNLTPFSLLEIIFVMMFLLVVDRHELWKSAPRKIREGYEYKTFN